MERPDQGKTRFTLTRSETRALIGLALLLLIGLIGQQLKRTLQSDPHVVLIENAEPVPLLSDSMAHRGEAKGSIDSPRLDAPSSKDVTSTPKPHHVSRPQSDSDEVVETPVVQEEIEPHEQAGLLDLNQANAEQLRALPGIGPVLSSRILDWRDAHGPFKRVDDLLLVKGIGEVRLEKLRALVTVQP